MKRIKCSRCGKSILKYPNDIKKLNYCSIKCARTKDRILMACIVCGKRKYLLPGQLMKNHGFCSNKCSKIGKYNPQWKENIGYAAIHDWARRWKIKPEFCECCEKERPYDLANISQEYKRDLLDWEWLCRSCHMHKDKRIDNLIKGFAPNVIQDEKTGRFCTKIN